MQTQLKLAALALAVLTIHCPFSICLGQGSLTPPGPPGPMMKTLDQIEPRTPIASAPFTISQSGSYYLISNLIVSTGTAITIATNDVILDLKGLTISSTDPSTTGYGILIKGGLRNLAIVNGFIQSGVANNGSGSYSGSGFAYGIFYDVGTPPANVLVSRISVSGCLNYGIYLANGDSTVVEACTVRTIGNYGIVASTINSSSAIDCGSAAINGEQVSDCRGQTTGFGSGVSASVAFNCYGTSANNSGLSASYSAQNCYGISFGSGDGLYAPSALNCHGESMNGRGLYATTANNCYGYSSSGYGLLANAANNCFGYSSANDGIHATQIAIGCTGTSSGGVGYDGVYSGAVASGCYGYSTGNSGTGVGAWTAQNCYGESANGIGIDTKVAIGCYGRADGSADGLRAIGPAIGCFGFSNSGFGIELYIGNSCVGQNTSGISENVSYKYNMP